MRAETAEIQKAIAALPLKKSVVIMEVCGTHTMAIARNGIKSMLPEKVNLLSGPGCPVCVTPAGVIDRILELAMRPDTVIATYGDMVRVPGSIPGDSLARRRALGAQVEIVYSPLDAVELAERVLNKIVVFLGAGFETSAPGTAAAVLAAEEKKLQNFCLLSMLKSVEPALRTLIASEEFSVQGFLCPGHVATITGEKGFFFLTEDYRMPAVISGFEPEEILTAIYRLLKQIAYDRPALENAYPRAVRREGNVLAQKVMAQCFSLRDDEWRGLGNIPKSGMKLKEQFEAFDAEKKFPEFFGNGRLDSADGETAGCRCGDVICGRLRSEQCPLFGRRCTPEDPVGPCMVSSEGACAAAYRYGGMK
mgnify:CR=1 FL=1